ncbi:Ig-like domain-containing protein [Neobacillus sp. CF12]|uniref:Ig-like domain-containing protein n=1 Tax=Neobacillus sp. CF12 TaxID=3055864 RepID=UPI0025A06027|nr:Ig-like domain-containing protein [Neobacillus sp. CF12]MDM5327589.1 Ig-like domain-containing protein [Neobacillus sp. CF12]
MKKRLLIGKKIHAAILTSALAISSLLVAPDNNVNAITAVETIDNVLAFPGAEGGGRYTSGGRFGDVYIVNSLEDYGTGEKSIQGSLRDALSKDNRFIIFNISGAINLKEPLSLRKRKNITIAGQTAPGDGITLTGYETNISDSENVIIRYLRFRPGAENVHSGDSMDAIWGRSMKNVMIDHISTSWSTDETMSLYRAENMTVQWSIVAESLAMSGHTKGRHGYGGIWGGVNTTFHHNLVANHTSRNPRLGGGTAEADDNNHIGLFDIRNNVIYNWGFNTAYGGGRAYANYMNNYMKPGLGTRASVESRVIDAGEKDKPGKFYINGNELEGNAEVSNDNSKGIYVSESASPSTEIVNEEFKMDGTSVEALRTTSAEEAYNEVLAKAGATYPKRDALDARIINEVKYNQGRFVNRHEEVGGLPYTAVITRSEDFDKDEDGIADEWELNNGLDPNNADDSTTLAVDQSGYTYLEHYVNSLVDMEFKPENPEVLMKTPTTNQIFQTGETITIEANVTDGTDIEKVEFYNGDKIIGKVTREPFVMSTQLPDGTYYISAKAISKSGLQTQATASIIHVNTKTNLKMWKSIDIGTPNIPGHTSLTDEIMTVKGSGKLIADEDKFHFAYRNMAGDGELIAKIETMTPVDHHAFAGLMVRESLEQDAKTVAFGLSYTKSYSWKENGTTYYRNPWSAYVAARYEQGGNMDDLGENLDSPSNATESGVALINDIPFKDKEKSLGYYLKLKRTGNVFSAEGSADGINWIPIGERTIEMNKKVYIGMAVDGNKVDNQLNNLNTATFTHIQLNFAKKQ